MAYSEILAPVGGQEQLLAAVRAGADAVYLGTKGFNARRNAKNFEGRDLAQTVAYCHGRGVKVFVTVNTLVMDGELGALEETAEEIAASGADAVILQDMAALSLFLNRYPSIRRCASTQTAVHNLSGALALRDLGYERIVLAREMSEKEMEKVVSRLDVETEAFVHGALCMSLSGACGLSCILGGRSGNRGLCAQPCRLNFRSPYREYALSLKDMSAIGRLRAWQEMGVTSFKIEGRMKRPEYVAAAVSACRLAREGLPYDTRSLEAVFSRGGFTDGYITGRRDARQFGIRSEEDVKASASVLSSLTELYRREYSHIPVDMRLTLGTEGSRLRLSCGEDAAEIEGMPAEPPKTRASGPEDAGKNLGKTGGTPFVLGDLALENPDGLWLSPGEMNRMRREGLDNLLALRETVRRHERKDWDYPELPGHSVREPRFRARFARFEQLHGEDVYEKISLPMAEIEKHPGLIEDLGDVLVAELPAAAWPDWEDRVSERLGKLADLGLKGVYAENIYGVTMAKRFGLACHGGCGLNVLNSQALAAYAAMGLEDLTLSWEIGMRDAAGIRGAMPFGLRAYGRLPLMRLRTCPMQGPNGCGSCRGGGSLRDRKGVEFPVSCDERRYSTLYNSVPLHLGGRQIAPADYLELYFTQETKEECERAMGEILEGREPEGPHTGGMYYRTLL